MESPVAMQPASPPLDQEEVLFPCKGCGEILEEGKAFELAGNRWHIDCFRCNSCNTLLDSDANLLLLGDGSLICNNCTYSCTACGNKIEDLAILTGDQAFCANCFKCRNCKRKIENLRYARTSQGIFCMQCHESLMARRRKKNRNAPVRTASANSAGSGGLVVLDKSLPALPDHIISDGTAGAEANALSDRAVRDSAQTDSAPQSAVSPNAESIFISPTDTANSALDEDFFIPVTLDTSPIAPSLSQPSLFGNEQGRDASVEQFKQDHAASQTAASPPTTFSKGAFSDLVAGSSRPSSVDRQRSRSRGSARIPGPSSPLARNNDGESPVLQSIETETTTERDRFKLQDAPKTRAAVSSMASSQNGSVQVFSNTQTTTSPTVESRPLSGESSISQDPNPISKARSSVKSSTRLSEPGDALVFERPVRDDSMRPPPLKQPIINRKEAPLVDPNLQVDSTGRPVLDNSGSHLAAVVGKQEPIKGGIPSGSLGISEGLIDALPARSPYRPIAAPREGDATAPYHKQKESVASLQSDSYSPREPSTPAQFVDGQIDDDYEQAGNDESDQMGLFRKMSKAMKHGRSQSDKIGSASPKWTRGPRNASVDISSPVTSSTDPREENIELRNKLRYSQQRIAELEAEKVALQEKVNGTVDIRQVNTELREKRSTMAILDTQREMVVRELEVMTEQLHRAKETSGPLNMDQIQNDVMRQFAASVAKLKDGLSGQVEDLIARKNELTNEISTLIQMKDKGFQEYESLSTRNTQLLEVNNQLVHQIQELYKQGKQPGAMPPQNGLGIYRDISMDNKSSIAGDSQLSGDTEIEPATVLSAPQVVNIRKGQPKKFNWKKGGQTVAKNVSKGFRGAFSSTNPAALNMRDDQHFEEGLPYSSILVSGEAPVTGNLPFVPSRVGSDQGRQGWGFLGQSNKVTGMTGLSAPQERALGMSSSSTSLGPPDAATTLFGSDLSARCEFEKRIIPTLVMSCISEVNQRGLRAEGIYRKSGSATQVKAIQNSFERDPSYNLSDPDLDIHAITGLLKQYFRRLPNPLITYDAYDPVLEAANSENENIVKANRIKEVVATLPKCHRETLEFLVAHLVQVMEYSEDNLMTSLALSVVFAPTIMRPMSAEREMLDMQAQRNAVQCMLESYAIVFNGE